MSEGYTVAYKLPGNEIQWSAEFNSIGPAFAWSLVMVAAQYSGEAIVTFDTHGYSVHVTEQGNRKLVAKIKSA